MKRTKQSTFAKRERSEKSTGFAPVGGENMTHTAKHTLGPLHNVTGHRPGPWIRQVLNDESEAYIHDKHCNAIARVYSLSDAALIAAAPAMYTAIQHLLEWAKGNRGSKTGNPYCIPEVRHALKTLASIQGVKDYLDADTTVEGGL